MHYMKIKQFRVCQEAWPVRRIMKKSSDDKYICIRCKRDKKSPKKFSVENNMIPKTVPRQLWGLTQCEEMLISHAFPVMLVYTRPGAGYLSYKGHIITLPHNVQKIATVLPCLPKDLPIVKFQRKGIEDITKEFHVRKKSF